MQHKKRRIQNTNPQEGRQEPSEEKAVEIGWISAFLCPHFCRFFFRFFFAYFLAFFSLFFSLFLDLDFRQFLRFLLKVKNRIFPRKKAKKKKAKKMQKKAKQKRKKIKKLSEKKRKKCEQKVKKKRKTNEKQCETKSEKKTKKCEQKVKSKWKKSDKQNRKIMFFLSDKNAKAKAKRIKQEGLESREHSRTECNNNDKQYNGRLSNNMLSYHANMSKVKADRIEPSQIFSCKMKGKEGIRMGSIFPHSFPCKRKECVHWSTSPHQVFPSSECQTQRIQLKERLVGGELDENWTQRNVSALIIVRMEPW